MATLAAGFSNKGRGLNKQKQQQTSPKEQSGKGPGMISPEEKRRVPNICQRTQIAYFLGNVVLSWSTDQERGRKGQPFGQ